MNNSTPRRQSWGPEHNHPAPKEGCPGCLHRFGTVIGTTAEISAMLDSTGMDNDPVAVALVQLVWSTNRHLDRIATAIEKLGGAA